MMKSKVADFLSASTRPAAFAALTIVFVISFEASAAPLQRFECESQGSDNVVCAALPPEKSQIATRIESGLREPAASARPVPSMVSRGDLLGETTGRARSNAKAEMIPGESADLRAGAVLDNSLAQAFELRDQLRAIEIFPGVNEAVARGQEQRSNPNANAKPRP